VRDGFLRSPLLERLGIEHGFGTRGSDASVHGLLHARQVHGCRVLRVPPVAEDDEADALVTDAPDVAVGVFTADCVPVLIADPEGRAVAAVHAGWRGSAKRVAEAAAGALSETVRCSPDSLLAAIGPHIGSCCYEVDDPVRAAVGLARVFSPSDRPGHYRLDLYELNRTQLLDAGLHPERIDRVPGCTACDGERFYSYRRDGQTGRLLHYVRRPARLLSQP
jgi:YfiH family protein